MQKNNASRFDWLSKWATYTPQAPAIVEYEASRVYSYSELNRAGTFLAKKMTEEWGLTKGDRLAILGENSAELVFLFVAAQKTGVILVPMNWRLSPPEIAYLLLDCAPKALFIQENFLIRLRANEESTQALTKVQVIFELETLAEEVRHHLQEKEEAHFESAMLTEEDPVFILYTSGTTGFPKGAIYTHKMLFWNSVNTALRLDLSSQDRSINVMPFFHTGGWNVLLTPFLHRGACMVLMKRFDAKDVLRALSRVKATIFMGVPTMLNMMADEEDFSDIDLSSLRYMIVGGEAMPIPLIETYHKKGIAIRQGYGMTEAGPNLTSLSQQDAIRKKGSIGMPNFYVETRVADEEGREVKAGTTGELLVRGPMLTPGYWQNPEATHKSIRQGWLHTGDMAVRDEEGYLFIVDRIKNMYISGGENVYPAEVERVIRTHTPVDEVVVVPMPDPKWGESGKAFVVLKENHDCTEAEIIAFCKEKLAKFKVPKEVVFVDALPQNGTGKIDRQALKKRT